MKAVDDAVDAEVEAAEGVGEEAVDVTKGVLTAAADLLSKTGVVLLIIIIVGIVLLVVRDLIYQASAWSTTELVLIVGSWDLWSALGPPRPARKTHRRLQGPVQRLRQRRGPKSGIRPATPVRSPRPVQGKAIAVAVEGIIDALKAFGIDLGLSFSLNSILKTALGPLISPWCVWGWLPRTHQTHRRTGSSRSCRSRWACARSSEPGRRCSRSPSSTSPTTGASVHPTQPVCRCDLRKLLTF